MRNATLEESPPAAPVDGPGGSTGADPDAAARVAAYDDETRRLTLDQVRKVDRLEARHEQRKEVAKKAKEELEDAEKGLRDLIKDREAQRGKAKQPTLFDEQGLSIGLAPPAAADPEAGDPEETPEEDEDDDDPEDDDEDEDPEDEEGDTDPDGDEGEAGAELHPACRAFPVDQLIDYGMNKGTLQLIRDGNGIKTLGELFLAGQPDPATGDPRDYTHLKGIGPARADEIGAALERFIEKYARTKAPAGV